MDRNSLSNKVTNRTLAKYFDIYLKSPPKPQKVSSLTKVKIKVDAQYYSGKDCIILVKAGKRLIYWRHFERESFINYLMVFGDLARLNYRVSGVTSDWHKSIVRAVKYIFKGRIPHQRCLVHTQRRCQSLLTSKPKTEAGKRLLRIVRYLNKISSKYEARIWMRWLEVWEEEYGEFVKKRSYGFKEDGSRTWWYTHKNLRSAFRTLKSSQEHLFLYLESTELDKDTNGIESEFSHLKQKINMHRGLKKNRKLAVIYWYIFFINQRRNC